MEKLRVYQLAKELGVSSREVIWALGQLGVVVKNHMSTVEPEHVVGVKTQLRIPVLPGEMPEPEPLVQLRPTAAPEPAAAPGAVPAPARERPAAQPSATDKERPAIGARAKPGSRRTKGKKAEQARREERRARRGRGRERTTFSDLQAGRLKEPVIIEGPMTVGNLAQRLGVRPSEAIRKLMMSGVMAGINQEIEPQVASALAVEMGFEVVERIRTPEDELLLQDEEAASGEAVPRWPVVTVMGHVDHGKTSLLDAIRKTKVTDQEAGGITQHIGASVVEIGDKGIVFLDTPGHEAFTAMRARGAKATDVAVVVVAADDGVMPQTVEAINHARAARVPVVVALNKTDRPDANPDRVKQQLADMGLVPEEWGGDTVCVLVSARTGNGIPELLEMLTLVADMQELKSPRAGKAKGTIIESELDKGLGPVATVLVQEGTLVVGDAFVAGSVFGRVRAMIDERGRRVRRAGPSMPVKVLGFQEVAAAGDTLQAVTDERKAKEIASHRQQRRRQQQQDASDRVRLDRLFEQFREGKVHQLNLILKADVQGSVEALSQALEKLETKELKVSVIHTGVGAITESDVMLAAASGAIIIGFNVRPDPNAKRSAEAEHVDIRTYRIIYEVIDDVERALAGLLAPERREVVIGRAEVRATFRVPRAGVVAGCYVLDGKIARNASMRVTRDGTVIAQTPIDSLKRFKDDVREVPHGFECGIMLKGFQDIKEGDILEGFIIEEVKT